MGPMKKWWKRIVKGMPEYSIHDDDGQSYVKIQTGRYAECIYKYGRLELPENVKGYLTLSFDYAIIQPSSNKKLDMHDYYCDDLFRNTIGDILVDIITSEEHSVEARNTDTQEFVDE